MNKIACLALIVLAALTASCQFPGSKIQPGDKIGDMEFISEYEQCPAPNFTEICGFPALVLGTCEIPADMTKFWVSTGWAEDTQEELELAWKDSQWSMTFDGHAVDLPAFGTFDMELDGQKARAWNVCISDPTPGKHTVAYKSHFERGSEPGNRGNTLIFTVLAADATLTP